jgi:pyruvate,water dikinase
VAKLTDPDWVPVMKRAAAVVTDQGGRTSHAAIVSRELGIPAVIGTQTATNLLRNGQTITVSCAEGETGNVYAGELPFEIAELDLDRLPKTRTHLMLNVANPDSAMSWWKLPCEGIGLARMEFVINHAIKVHPLALLHPDKVQTKKERGAIRELVRDFDTPADYFIVHLARGIAKIAASRHPDPVIVRFSDFKTNEYANLLGGGAFEPHEENPMLGFRGASRYYSEAYKDAFRLECRALRRARETLGLRNVRAMIPFCRTLDEADRVIAILREEGLERGKDDFELYVMAEIPSNIVLADEFSERFDGFSIGSNDLTQLVLGVDRDSTSLRHVFDERPCPRPPRRHLRPGTERSPGLRRIPRPGGHRFDLSQPRLPHRCPRTHRET